ncbi:MAG: tetratricopeptide repeat protein [Myxococcales bacterium]|nr:tetratricopeptide repeat protein [Myxococcales bacterium]
MTALVIGAPALAAPPLDPLLGPATVAPPRQGLVDWHPPAAVPANADPAVLATDPVAFARFIETRPDRLDVARMEPALVLTLAQLLLRADRTFVAEKLLYDAAQHWPERADLTRAWARVLISLGRPQAAERALTAAIARSPGDAILRYLLARAILGGPRQAETEQKAKAALEAVLEIDPQFRDADGVTAADVRAVIERLATP